MTTLIKDDTSFEEKLLRRSEVTKHLDFQLGDLSFNAGKTPSVTIAGDSYALTDSSFRHLAGEMNIPVPYARRIPDDLLAYTMNYFVKGNRSNHLAALVEGDRLRSFMKVNAPYVSNAEMLSSVREAVGDNYTIKYGKITDSKVSFSILPDNYQESIDGSNLFGGVKISYSDAWDSHPSIDSYIWRELCSNGMINELENRKFRVTGSSHDDVMRQIRDFSAIAIEKLPELFESFTHLIDEKVDDYMKIIRQIVLEYKLPNKVLTRLSFWAVHPDFLATVTGEKIKNMNDVVNLITWTGSHDSELTPEIRQRLLEIGGNLTLNHAERCGSCGSAV